jgi:hypothetical protein
VEADCVPPPLEVGLVESDHVLVQVEVSLGFWHHDEKGIRDLEVLRDYLACE